MKLFLKKTALFLTIPLGLLLLVFITINYLNYKIFAGYKINPATTTLYFGDSHVQMAVNDKLLPASLNLSQNAESFYYSYYKIETILKTNPSVQNIYLGFSYHSLSSYFNEYIYGKYSKDISARYFFILPLREKFRCLGYNLKQFPEFIKYVLLNGAKNLTKKTNSYSFLGKYEANNEHFSAAQKSMDRRLSDQYYEDGKLRGLCEINIDYLNKIIDLCEKKNITLIVLNTPMHPYYKSKIPVKFIEKYKEIIEQRHLKEINFNNLILADSCFIRDGDHVSNKGALLTTDYLSNN